MKPQQTFGGVQSVHSVVDIVPGKLVGGVTVHVLGVVLEQHQQRSTSSPSTTTTWRPPCEGADAPACDGDCPPGQACVFDAVGSCVCSRGVQRRPARNHGAREVCM